jgi:hypothetical protein
MMVLVALVLAGAAGCVVVTTVPEQDAPAGAAALPEDSPMPAPPTPAAETEPAATAEPIADAPAEPAATFTAVPAATATAEPTATFTPLPTVPPLVPDPPHDTLTFADDFSNPASGWTVLSKDTRDRYYENDEWVYWIKQPGWDTWASGSIAFFSDFTFEADARLVEGPEQARFGLIFRKKDNDNFYYFYVDGLGRYKIGKMIGGEWQPVENIDWRMSPYVGPGSATNRLKVVAEGPRMSFYVNNQYLTTVQDGDLPAGEIGLIADAPREVETFKAAFDNVRAFIPSPRPPVVPEPAHTELLYRSNFGNTAVWGEKSSENYDIFHDNGRYNFLLKGSPITAGYWNGERSFSDFTVETDIHLLEDTGEPNGRIEAGLIFRAQDVGNSYIFIITDSGDYIINKRVNGEVRLIENGYAMIMASPHINLGQSTNRLKVVAAGPDISFYVNGQHLSTFTDDTFSRGYIGLIAGRIAEGGSARVAFENLEVYGSAQEAAAAPPPTPTPVPAPPPPPAPAGPNKIAFVSTRDGNQDIYVMNPDGSGVTRLTDHPAEDHSPVWSPDGGTIAFVSNRDGNAEIYLMAADGRGQTNLSENPAEDYDPAWAGNGAWLAFTTSRDDPIRTDIWVMRTDGSEQSKLQNFGISPAWSPDNSRIAAIFPLWGADPPGGDAGRRQRRTSAAAPDGHEQLPGLVARQWAHCF